MWVTGSSLNATTFALSYILFLFPAVMFLLTPPLYVKRKVEKVTHNLEGRSVDDDPFKRKTPIGTDQQYHAVKNRNIKKQGCNSTAALFFCDISADCQRTPTRKNNLPNEGKYGKMVDIFSNAVKSDKKF